MKRMKLISAALTAILGLGAIGCDNGSNVPSTRPAPYAAYTPTSGQNLSPGIAPYAHGDPDWPMDAGGGGGGGNTGRR